MKAAGSAVGSCSAEDAEFDPGSNEGWQYHKLESMNSQQRAESAARTDKADRHT